LASEEHRWLPPTDKGGLVQEVNDIDVVVPPFAGVVLLLERTPLAETAAGRVTSAGSAYRQPTGAR
jgi:hypothetical protein